MQSVNQSPTDFSGRRFSQSVAVYDRDQQAFFRPQILKDSLHTWRTMGTIPRAMILYALFTRAYEVFGDDNEDWMLIGDLLKMGPEAS